MSILHTLSNITHNLQKKHNEFVHNHSVMVKNYQAKQVMRHAEIEILKQDSIEIGEKIQKVFGKELKHISDIVIPNEFE